jgi:sarcosine oxidase gamma subunit
VVTFGVALMGAVVAGAGCSESSDPQVSRSEACEQFNKVVADYATTDQQSASAFSSLAARTEDPALAAAIQRVANGFARSDPAVSSAEVTSLCR